MKWVKRRIGAILLTAFGLLLVSLFVPTMCGKIPVNSDRTRAENTAHNLKNSISAYFTEYREYPLRSPDVDLTVDTRHQIMDILLGSEKEKPRERNPRGIAFYTDKAAKPMKGEGYRNGVVLDSQGGGELFDSWGKHYRVRFDTDFDNRIENPEAAGTLLPDSIAIWSAGKDGDFDTWKDNVKTW